MDGLEHLLCSLEDGRWVLVWSRYGVGMDVVGLGDGFWYGVGMDVVGMGSMYNQW